MDHRECIERGLAHYLTLVSQRPELSGELERARADFQVGQPPPDQSPHESELAERRFLEHFLFERVSEPLDGVPAEALVDEWKSMAEAELCERADMFLGSHAGVFEVTGISEESFWLRDMLARGEYPVQEPEVAGDLDKGDVVVGRLHPVGDASYRLSPAASCYRSPELLEALQRDLERQRQGHRGSMRIQQRELERMFHAQPVEPSRIIDEAREFLISGGIEVELVDDFFEELASRPPETEDLAPGHGDVLGAILDQLAFETELDLESARKLLISAWRALVEQREQEGQGDSGESLSTRADTLTPMPAPKLAPRSGQADNAEADVPSALADFDAGRREGRDLEQLFDELESKLGVAADAPEAEPGPPAFPGVVAALVGEFRWELEKHEGAGSLPGIESLDELARFAAHVEQPEELGVKELIGFAAAHALDERIISDESAGLELIGVVQAFARWADTTQGLPLQQEFDELARGLRSSLPRILRVRCGVELPARGGRLYRIEREGHAVRLVDADDERIDCQLEPELASWLRSGDLVRAELGAEGRLERAAYYPPQAAQALGLEQG